jgi:hypothetical protein
MSDLTEVTLEQARNHWQRRINSNEHLRNVAHGDDCEVWAEMVEAGLVWSEIAQHFGVSVEVAQGSHYQILRGD